MDKQGNHFYDTAIKEHDHDGVYAPKPHTHSYVNKDLIAGDTMTGNLYMGGNLATDVVAGDSNREAVIRSQLSFSHGNNGYQDFPGGIRMAWWRMGPWTHDVEDDVIHGQNTMLFSTYGISFTTCFQVTMTTYHTSSDGIVYACVGPYAVSNTTVKWSWTNQAVPYTGSFYVWGTAWGTY